MEFYPINCDIFFREKVDALRWGANALGFTGARFIVRPSPDVFTCTALMPIGAIFCYAPLTSSSKLMSVMSGHQTWMETILLGIMWFLPEDTLNSIQRLQKKKSVSNRNESKNACRWRRVANHPAAINPFETILLSQIYWDRKSVTVGFLAAKDKIWEYADVRYQHRRFALPLFELNDEKMWDFYG